MAGGRANVHLRVQAFAGDPENELPRLRTLNSSLAASRLVPARRRNETRAIEPCYRQLNRGEIGISLKAIKTFSCYLLKSGEPHS